MYNPTGLGKDRMFGTVVFSEAAPPQHLKNIVHRFLEVRTTHTLESDYRFHALPDACTYLVLDQRDRTIGGVTRLGTRSEEFNLGRDFHFINIRFFPGVWTCTREKVSYGMIAEPYRGALPIAEIGGQLLGRSSEEAQEILTSFASRLLDMKCIGENLMTKKIFSSLDRINSVADMADCLSLSPRQLQRKLKLTTGFAPHDFLKILRLQKAIRENDSSSYADQSHFINSFRKATGYTPLKYNQKFDIP